MNRFYTAVPFLAILSMAGSPGPEIPARETGQKHIVRLVDIEFAPHRIRADVGDTIVFINKDRFEHNVYIVRTANSNDILFPARSIPSGDSIDVTIQQKGLYTVYCTIHGGMTARLSTTGSFELTEAEKRAAAESAPSFPPIVKTGENLFWGKAQCYQCHQLGNRGSGSRGPNLRDIGFRARFQAAELGLESATHYLIQSIVEPGAYVVAGYTKDMPNVYQPPIDLGEEEIKAIITFLQSQGGNVDTWAINLNPNRLHTLPSMNPFQSGDPERGKGTFTEVGCANCHSVGGHGGGVGPDLTAIGATRDWAWLATSLLDPDDEIGTNWRGVTVFLDWGEPVSGMLRANTDSVVTVMIGGDEFETIPRPEVERVEVSETSSMPRNYGEILTFQQIADLITYMQSLKGM